MYIGGKWVSSDDGRVFSSSDPYLRTEWATFPCGSGVDVARAVDAARHGFEHSDWARRPRDRAATLRRLADLIARDAAALAAVESQDTGKTLREALGLYRAVPSWYRQAAAMAETQLGDVPNGADPDVVSMTLREPYGVIGIQTPWNTPGLILAQAAGPALAAGNAIVVKPSEVAPGSTLELARLFDEADFPPGIVNFVTGLGEVVGAAVCANPGVDKLVFTGGSEGGRIVATHAAGRLVPTVLELGGKSANIVFDDADLAAAAQGVVEGFTGSAGQSCVCGSRTLVHASRYDEFVERLVAIASRLQMGDPSDPQTDVGPICSETQLSRIRALVGGGVEEGGEVVCGGNGASVPDGWFYPPTILSKATNKMTIAREEVFGPVTVCIPFETEREAVAMANDSPYGLGAGIWTRDVSRAHRVARQVRAGSVWVNHYRRGDASFPFGGYGRSGYGRVNGPDGLHEMTRVKSVQILLSENPDDVMEGGS